MNFNALSNNFYTNFAAAYIRSQLPDLEAACTDELLSAARAQGLKLQYFKRTQQLPRVKAVLGALQGIQPENLLDIGSGRGVFLWPLLDLFRNLEVTAIDLLDYRIDLLRSVREGGVERLNYHHMDVCDMSFEDKSFDVSTVLEVLEHLEEPAAAVSELLRVSRRFVLASVPSKEDNNPEHIQLFGRNSLKALFLNAGAQSVKIDYVLGHIVCVARV